MQVFPGEKGIKVSVRQGEEGGRFSTADKGGKINSGNKWARAEGGEEKYELFNKCKKKARNGGTRKWCTRRRTEAFKRTARKKKKPQGWSKAKDKADVSNNYFAQQRVEDLGPRCEGGKRLGPTGEKEKARVV